MICKDMIYKFNNGNGALLCDHCRTVIATGERIPEEVHFEDRENTLYFCCRNCAIQHKGKLYKKINILEPENGLRTKPDKF